MIRGSAGLESVRFFNGVSKPNSSVSASVTGVGECVLSAGNCLVSDSAVW